MNAQLAAWTKALAAAEGAGEAVHMILLAIREEDAIPRDALERLVDAAHLLIGCIGDPREDNQLDGALVKWLSEQLGYVPSDNERNRE
jgi:hypothetical protein